VDIVLRTLGLRHLVLHLGRIFLTRTVYVLEVLRFILPIVCKGAVPVLVNLAKNLTTIRVCDSTPEGLVSDHALWFVIGLVGEIVNFAKYEVQGCAFSAVITEVAGIRHEGRVNFSGNVSPLSDCNSTLDLLTVVLLSYL